MRSTHALAITLLATMSACHLHERGGSAEHTDLIGRWELTHIYRGGVDINLDHLEGAIREIRDSSYSITPASGLVITGKYTANNEASPKTIDEVVDNGRCKGESLKGIYRVHDRRLTISFGGPGEPRPASFESEAGTNHTVAIHRLAR